MPLPAHSRFVLVAISAAAILAVGVAILATGSHDRGNAAGADTPAAEGAKAVTAAGLSGGLVSPRVVAPPLSLTDENGARVDLADDRGDAVFVTFLYTNCPDVCPLTTEHLKTALDQMPAAERKRVRIIAVSVDPKGDTPSAVRRFLARHRMTGRMSYLVGSAGELRPTWQRWGVAAVTDTSSSFVSHSALIYGVAADGRLTTVYPWNMEPSAIVHDTPRLLDPARL